MKIQKLSFQFYLFNWISLFNFTFTDAYLRVSLFHLSSNSTFFTSRTIKTLARFFQFHYLITNEFVPIAAAIPRYKKPTSRLKDPSQL